MPALDHERVHSTRTILGAGEQLARSDHLNHLVRMIGMIIVMMMLGMPIIPYSL